MTITRIEVLCCPLTEIDDELLARYETLLDAEELQRLHGFRSAASAKEFLIGRALLRTALAARLHCETDALRFNKNADGKPSLSYPPSVWQFNLTHSHNWVALALCEGATIGVDIESYVRRNNLRAIAGRFFSAEENTRLAQCNAEEWLDYFFAIWTLKEAHGKALGCGLSKILSCSSIAVNLSEGTIEWSLSGAASVFKKMASWLYQFDKHCALALVAHGAACAAPAIFRCVPLRSIENLPVAIRARCA